MGCPYRGWLALVCQCPLALCLDLCSHWHEVTCPQELCHASLSHCDCGECCTGGDCLGRRDSQSGRCGAAAGCCELGEGRKVRDVRAGEDVRRRVLGDVVRPVPGEHSASDGA